MVRTSTPLRTRESPVKGKKKVSSNKNTLLRSVFKAPRSPVVGKHRNSPFKFKPVRDSPYKRPALAPKSKLQTIREVSPEENEEDRGFDHSRDVEDLTGFSMDEVSDDDEESSNSDYEGWDDETTLIAKFQENAREPSSREKLAELANQLEGPMQARADQLKQYLAHTMAPATRKVKEVHSTLEEKVDVPFGIGVLGVDNACKEIEQSSLHDEDKIKQAYAEAKHNVGEYFKQLKDAYQERERLWTDLKEAVEKSAGRTLASLSALTSDVENTIVAVEKKAKDLSKSGGKDNKAKLLRDLLAEM